MFILYFDEKYFKWAPMLIESIGINEPKERICVYGINLTEAQMEILKSYDVSYFEYDINNRSVLSFERRARKFTNINKAKIIQSQADFLLKAFEAFPEETLFMIMDVDCLIIRPLDELKKEMRRHDLAGIVQEIDESKIACGFKAVNRTGINKRMIEEWNDFLLNGHYYHGKSPLSLMEFYKKHRSGIRFLELDHRYIDPRSQEDSLIWSAHKSKFGRKAERFELYKKKLEELKR